MLGTFSPPLRVSDPNMQHGTCVTHVPWCMPGSQSNGFLWRRLRGKRFRHSRACVIHTFAYLARSPLDILLLHRPFKKNKWFVFKSLTPVRRKRTEVAYTVVYHSISWKIVPFHLMLFCWQSQLYSDSVTQDVVVPMSHTVTEICMTNWFVNGSL